MAPQNSLILYFGQWSISLWEGLLQRVEITRNLQWRLSVGKHLLVRELTQNFEPLYYLPGENRSENTTEENTTEIPQEHQVEGFPP